MDAMLNSRSAVLAVITVLVLVIALPLQSRAGQLRIHGYGSHHSFGLDLDTEGYVSGYLHQHRYGSYTGRHYYRYPGPYYSYHHYERFHRGRRAPRVYAFTIRPERRDYGSINGRPLIDWSHRRVVPPSEIARREGERDGVSVEPRLPRRPSRVRGAARRADREAQTRRYPRNAR